MDTKIINIAITNSEDSILTMKAEKKEMGTQYDSGASMLVFTRPSEFIDDDLNLIFKDSKRTYDAISIGKSNEYEISNGLTQETNLTLQVFFKNESGDMEFTSLQDFTLRKSLKAGNVTPEILPSVENRLSKKLEAANLKAGENIELAAEGNNVIISSFGGDGSGAPGKSAYQIAVDNGFTGTEAEWLESLKGEPGEPGKDGTGEGGGSSVKIGSNGKLVIDEVEQSGLNADNADKLGGYSASAFAKISDIPGAAPVLAPTITLTNLIKNADFTQGADGLQDWMINRSILVKVENGCVTLTNSHTSTSVCGINQTFKELDKTHIYFVNCKMRYHMNRSIADGAVRRMFGIASDTKIFGYMSDVPDVWMSGACTYGYLNTVATADSGYWLFGTTYNANAFASGDYTIELKEPQIIDLTAAFGVGNEPSLSWCIRNVPFFVGTKTISYKEYRRVKNFFIGDSITSGVGTAPKSYPFWIDDVSCVAGFGGASMISSSSEPSKSYSAVALADAFASRNFDNQIANIGYYTTDEYAHRALKDITTADLSGVENIFIAYGTNDLKNGAEKGSDDKDDRTTYTFKGAMRYTIEKLQTNFPRARIIFIAPPFRSDYDPEVWTNSKGLKLVDYIEAMKEVCAKFNVPVIDTLRGLGVTSFNSAEFLGDAVHPKYQGFVRIAELIAAQTGLGVKEIN